MKVNYRGISESKLKERERIVLLLNNVSELDGDVKEILLMLYKLKGEIVDIEYDYDKITGMNENISANSKSIKAYIDGMNKDTDDIKEIVDEIKELLIG